MATLYLDHDQTALGWKAGAIELRLPGEAPRRVPLRDLDRVVIASSCTISAAALNELWEAGAALLVLGRRRHTPGARFSGGAHNDATIRLRQFGLVADDAERLTWATALVAVRLREMRRVALGIARRRQRGPQLLAPALSAIERTTERLAADPPGSIETLRGIEGALMAGWFAGFARLLAPSLGFTGRRRRPPPDPVNAALSLGYTLATAEAARAATIAGFDTAIGLVHGLAHGREALALDLVEPARPHVDRMVHDLFHDRVLTERQMTREPDGAVLLGKAARQSFYSAWEDSAAPVIRRLLRALCAEAVRRLRARPPGPAERAMSGPGDAA